MTDSMHALAAGLPDSDLAGRLAERPWSADGERHAARMPVAQPVDLPGLHQVVALIAQPERCCSRTTQEQARACLGVEQAKERVGRGFDRRHAQVADGKGAAGAKRGNRLGSVIQSESSTTSGT